MKKLRLYSPYLKYLFIPGLVLSVAGGVAGAISQAWTPLYVGLLVIGGLLLIAWLIYCGLTAQGFWSRRSTQAGTNAAIATVSLVVILGLVNFLAIRAPFRIDLTDNQLFTLSSESQTLVKGLTKPMKVWLFVPQLSPRDRKLLDNYQAYNPNLTYEAVDPQQKPNLVAQFQVKAPGEVYLESGSKKERVQSLMTAEQSVPLSETNLTNAIAKIQRNHQPQIYFLQGHDEAAFKEGEDGLTQAIEQLQSKGFKVMPLNLAEQSAIPSDADAIVLAGPKRDFFPQEVAALKAYSDRGGSLLLLIDPKTQPNLDPLLKEWGVTLDPRIVIDASGSGNMLGLGPATPIINRYGQHPITEQFGNGLSFFPLARPVASKETKDVKAYRLVESNDKMWAESDLNSPELAFDPQKDLAGPFDLGIALTRTLPTPDKTIPTPQTTPTTNPSPNSQISPNISPTPPPSPKNSTNSPKTEAKMVVFGNSGFIRNGWFDKQLNGDLLLNSLEWLTNDSDQALTIRPREAKNRQIVLSKLQASLIAWGSFLVVPLFGLVMAGVTWWRRR